MFRLGILGTKEALLAAVSTSGILRDPTLNVLMLLTS